jgi:protein-tyrosine phosphatase
MFFFNRNKKSAYIDFSTVGLDMHSHLIPGVDDGAKNVEDSIQIINGLTELGFSQFITTPHTLQDIHPNTKKSLQQGYQTLAEHLHPHISLSLSSEYYLDDAFEKQLQEDQLLPFAGNRLLIEFSQTIKPLNLEEIIFDLSIRGFQVVLAHPERYLFFHKDLKYYSRLKQMGVELQVNALSLTLHYGKKIKLIAEQLIDKNMIDFIGTDIHHVKHLEGLRQVPTTKHFAKLIDSGLLKNKELIIE